MKSKKSITPIFRSTHLYKVRRLPITCLPSSPAFRPTHPYRVRRAKHDDMSHFRSYNHYQGFSYRMQIICIIVLQMVRPLRKFCVCFRFALFTLSIIQLYGVAVNFSLPSLCGPIVSCCIVDFYTGLYVIDIDIILHTIPRIFHGFCFHQYATAY